MLAIRTIAGAIIYSINGDPLAGVKVKFLLVAADGKPTQAWDVANKVPAIGMLEVITGSNGLMPDVNLPPNDGLDRVTQYLCHADTPGFRPFLGSIPSGAGSLPWADFMAAGAPLTPAEISALQTHIADHANPHGVTKAQVGLGNADNTSDTNKPVSTAQAAADTATLNTARAYADGLVVGLLDDRGTYNASDNTWPAAGGSGVAGEILKGDMWYIGTGGTLGGTAVSIGDAIRALTDAPGQVAANWGVMEGNYPYVPENVANKTTSSAPGDSDVLYMTQKAVHGAIAAAVDTTAFNVQTGTAYTFTDADAVYGKRPPKLVTFGNAAPVAAAIPTNAVVPLPVGARIDLLSDGVGKVTIGGVGVTINSYNNNKSLAGKYAAATLIKEATDTWYLIGNLVA